MNQTERLVDDVMKMLLSGEHPVLKILASQYEAASLSGLELTGVGFFANFNVPLGAPRIAGDKSLYFGGVHADIDGVRNGAGFVLHIERGSISFLEGYTYDQPWPSELRGYRLMFNASDNKRDLSGLD